MMEPKVYHLLSVVLMACLGSCDIVVNANARTALKSNVKVDPSLSWCKVFNNQDFPPFTQCENKEDNFFDYFPACCNGAYKCRAGRVWNLYLCPPKTVSDGTSKCIELKGGVCPYNRNGSDSGITMASTSTTATTKIITAAPTIPITLPTPKFSVYPNGSTTPTTPTHPIVSVLPTDSTVATTLTELTDPATSEPTTIPTDPNVSVIPTDPISSVSSTITTVSVISTDADLSTTPPAPTDPTNSEPPTISTSATVTELSTEPTPPAASAFPTDSPTSMVPTIHPDTTVPTTTTAPPAPEPFCATEPFGKKIPHPADCTKYIVCDSITGTAQGCYEGYIFYKPFAACLPGNKKTCERYSLGR